jgi:hypothetical protein
MGLAEQLQETRRLFDFVSSDLNPERAQCETATQRPQQKKHAAVMSNTKIKTEALCMKATSEFPC